MRKPSLPLAATMPALLAALLALLWPAAAPAQMFGGPPGENQLTPEIVAAQPRLTDADVTTFVELFNQLLTSGNEESDIVMFARTRGLSMIRLNYVAVKVAFKYVPASNQRAMVKDLGLGLLLSADEKALLERRAAEIGPIMEFFRQGLL
jgi:hypothetical protein